MIRVHKIAPGLFRVSTKRIPRGEIQQKVVTLTRTGGDGRLEAWEYYETVVCWVAKRYDEDRFGPRTCTDFDYAVHYVVSGKRSNAIA